MEQRNIAVMGATRISVGLSAIVQVKPEAYLTASNLKIISGGGTLELVGVPAALTGSSAAGWGLGYPIGVTEALSVDGPVVYYFAATGATMTFALSLGYTNGATTI